MTNTQVELLVDYNDEGEEILHPILSYLRENKKAAIESVKMIGDVWYDDHCPCVEVEVKVDGKMYKYEDWWLSTTGLNMYARAECEGEKAMKARKQLIKHLRDHLGE